MGRKTGAAESTPRRHQQALALIEEHLFGGAAENPVFVFSIQECQSIAHEGDGGGVGVAVIQLIRAIAGPHEAAGPKASKSAFTLGACSS